MTLFLNLATRMHAAPRSTGRGLGNTCTTGFSFRLISCSICIPYKPETRRFVSPLRALSKTPATRWTLVMGLSSDRESPLLWGVWRLHGPACAQYTQVGVLDASPHFLQPLLTATRTGARSSLRRPWCALSPCAHTVAGRLRRESRRGLCARYTRGVNLYTCVHMQILDHTHTHIPRTHAQTRTTSCACTCQQTRTNLCAGSPACPATAAPTGWQEHQG